MLREQDLREFVYHKKRDDGWQVWLCVGRQSFPAGPVHETVKEAEVYGTFLRKALKNLLLIHDGHGA